MMGLLVEFVAVPCAIVMIAVVSALDVSEKMILHGQSFAETVLNVVWLVLGSLAAQYMPKRTVVAGLFSFWASLVLLLVAIVVCVLALIEAPQDGLTIGVTVLVALVVGWSLVRYCSPHSSKHSVNASDQLSIEMQERELRARKKFWLLLFVFSLFMFLCQLMLLLLFRNDNEDREGTKVNWFLVLRVIALGIVVGCSGVVAISTPTTVMAENEMSNHSAVTPYVQGMP